MKILISEDKVFKTMDMVFNRMYPQIKLPLKMVLTPTSNRFGGVELDKLYYYSDDFWVFKKNHDNDISNSKWEVNDLIYEFFNIFGDDLFEKYVEKKFHIDLKNKGNKTWDWLFT